MNSRSSTRPPEAASSSISSNSRRVRSMLTPLHEGLVLVAMDLDLAGDQRLGRRSSLEPPAAAHDRLDARDQLLGMAGLGQPVIGAEAQAAHALGDRRAAGADDDAEARAARRRAARATPSRSARSPRGRPRSRQAHRDDRLAARPRTRARGTPSRARSRRLPSTVQEARVAVEDRDAQRYRRRLED